MSKIEVYRYPYTMLTEQTDYLQIDVVDYKPIGKSIVSRPGDRRNQGKNKLKTILLPIPSNISDSNSTKYGDSNLNSIGAALVGGIKGVMDSGKALGGGGKDFGAELTSALANAGESIVNSAGGIAGAGGFVTRSLASDAAAIAGVNITPDQILARSEGSIMNPNMELLFNGPSLRSFRFSFKMTPRNQTEADEIRNIIKCFKKSMAPKVASAGDTTNTTFLKTPDIFELRYRQGNIEHKFLNKFKQCFMESINVNYTADGTYATYDDGTPVSMVMDLGFKEIEPVYDIDYDGKYNGVGY
jgi:hypothetical protein|tara:strand:- start:740 stop:1639 length:900 start_codon:yes stop_codon:yes gene_type:complete